MPADTRELTKDWIRWLKNSQIVDLKSDPNTGKLNYRREVSADDLASFLDARTDFTQEQINNAIKMVLARKNIANQPSKLQKPEPKQPGKDLSTWSYYGMSPGDPVNKQQKDSTGQRKIGNNANKPKGVKYDPKSVSDVNYRDLPGKNMKEDIRDLPEPSINENDVETIFRILLSPALAGSQNQPENNVSPEEALAKKQEDMRKIKELIRDVMTDSQRKSLWRILSDA